MSAAFSFYRRRSAVVWACWQFEFQAHRDGVPNAWGVARDLAEARRASTVYLNAWLRDSVHVERPGAATDWARDHLWMIDLALDALLASVPPAAPPPPAFAALGLKWPCTRTAVIAAWKRVAFKLHPDRGGDPKRFIDAKRAYDDAFAFVTAQRSA